MMKLAIAESSSNLGLSSGNLFAQMVAKTHDIHAYCHHHRTILYDVSWAFSSAAAGLPRGIYMNVNKGNYDRRL